MPLHAVVRAVSQALLHDNQMKPILKWSELPDAADLQSYLQRAASRQRRRQEEHHAAYVRKLARKFAE